MCVVLMLLIKQNKGHSYLCLQQITPHSFWSACQLERGGRSNLLIKVVLKFCFQKDSLLDGSVYTKL